MQNAFIARLLTGAPGAAPAPAAEPTTVKELTIPSPHVHPRPRLGSFARSEPDSDGVPLPVTTERIRLYRQRYHPADEQPDVAENIEMHDSALFDVVVEADFYDGRRLRIPQQSTPAGWEAPF
jgi:hypothetical protein